MVERDGCGLCWWLMQIKELTSFYIFIHKR